MQRAVWPRVLTFSVPESLIVEGSDEPLLLGLVVTDPEIVRPDEYPASFFFSATISFFNSLCVLLLCIISFLSASAELYMVSDLLRRAVC